MINGGIIGGADKGRFPSATDGRRSAVVFVGRLSGPFDVCFLTRFAGGGAEDSGRFEEGGGVDIFFSSDTSLLSGAGI